jgi:hypothetical protein
LPTSYWSLKYGPVHAERIVSAWKTDHKFNKDNYTFAEDGIFQQCFFTKNKLLELFQSHGIEIKKGPKKICYPWKLIKRFGYGLLDAKFELYDWYIWYIVGVKK